MFEKHMKNEQTYQVCENDGIIDRNKDYLLSEPVNYNQDGVKPGE